MIDPRELRLHNYVLSDGGSYCRIGGIPCTDRDEWAEHLHPIPLTEDILLKCGFKKGHSMDLICDDCFTMPILTPDMLVDVFKNKSENSWYIHIDDEACCSVGYAKDIQYLHELQNIFYDLTKIPLDIKL